MIDGGGLQRTKNSSDVSRQLARLGAFHYALAGLQAVMAAVLSVMLLDTPAEGWAVTVSWTLVFSVAALAILTLVAGRRIAGRQVYSFCLTVAALNCFYFPFGTALGILTLITLKRPSVRAAFPPSRPYHPNVDTWENRTLP
jgi:hypothetical protein